MYQSAYYDRNRNIVHIWDDEQGRIEVPYQKYAYQVDPKGEFVTMDNIKVKKVTSWDKNAEKEGLIYEHDVSILMRTLIDRYWQSDEISKNHRIMFLDIEVAKEGRYSEPREAANTVTSIAYYVERVGYVCLILDPSGQTESGKYSVKTTAGKDIEVILQSFTNESQLLTQFIAQFARIRPTITSGWNVMSYDWVYLHNRIQAKLGKAAVQKLSEIGIVDYKEIDSRNQEIKIAGSSCLDFMFLYKKFTPSEQPRYTLDAISTIELGRGKVKYDGDLHTLYQTDINKFIEYNVNDVELCVALNEKLDYIAIAQGLCHKGHIPYENVEFPSMYIDGASLVYCKRNNMVAMKTINSGAHEIAKGAFVKVPTPGLYRYVFDLDLTSLYPSVLMSLNISPETKWGKVLNFNAGKFDGDFTIVPKPAVGIVEEFSFMDTNEIETDDLRQFLIDNNLSISSIGILYKKDKPGLIPSILSSWFDERKSYSDQAAIEKKSGNNEGYRYYDRKQYITKILLNTFYGTLLLPTFRFYDRENGESVTVTGQEIIQHSIRTGNYFYNKILKTEKEVDFCIAGDTDSCFFPALPLIPNVEEKTEEELVQMTLKITSRLQKFINDSYDEYALTNHNISTHRLNIKQEMIGRRAFWGKAKKRYAMWIINKKGLSVDELDVKGFDVVRSNFPAAFRKQLEQIIIDILHDVPVEELNDGLKKFKHQYTKSPLTDILLPTGVKEMSKYKHAQKGTPIHVKSAQNYNKFLELFKIDSVPLLDDGDKIVWGYVKENPYHFETIALRGYDDPSEIMEFAEKYVDKNQIFERALISKVSTIWEDLGWGQINLNENSEDFF